MARWGLERFIPPHARQDRCVGGLAESPQAPEHGNLFEQSEAGPRWSGPRVGRCPDPNSPPGRGLAQSCHLSGASSPGGGATLQQIGSFAWVVVGLRPRAGDRGSRGRAVTRGARGHTPRCERLPRCWSASKRGAGPTSSGSQTLSRVQVGPGRLLTQHRMPVLHICRAVSGNPWNQLSSPLGCSGPAAGFLLAVAKEGSPVTDQGGDVCGHLQKGHRTRRATPGLSNWTPARFWSFVLCHGSKILDEQAPR